MDTYTIDPPLEKHSNNPPINDLHPPITSIPFVTTATGGGNDEDPIQWSITSRIVCSMPFPHWIPFLLRS